MQAVWLEFFGLMLVFGVSAVVPGADFAMVLRQSVAHGRKAALFTSAGIATALIVHGSYTLLGVGIVVAQSQLLFDVLKWAGVAYLAYIGIDALRSPPPQPIDLDAERQPALAQPRTAFVAGFLTNLLNPKAVLFFLALFTTLVGAATPIAVKALYVLVMSVVLFSWFALVSVFFTTPAVRSGFYRLGKWFNWLTGTTFIVLAVGVALARQQ